MMSMNGFRTVFVYSIKSKQDEKFSFMFSAFFSSIRFMLPRYSWYSRLNVQELYPASHVNNEFTWHSYNEYLNNASSMFLIFLPYSWFLANDYIGSIPSREVDQKLRGGV